VFEIKGSRFVDLKENGDNIKKRLGYTKPIFSHQITNYNFRIVLTFALNSSF
jgi:hypothetical protein